MDKTRKSTRLVPDEPVIILTLIGLMLTGAILYNRAANLQRFLEPSLAVLAPRTTLAARISDLARQELGSELPDKLIVRSSRIMAHKSLFSSQDPHVIPPFMPKLASGEHRFLEGGQTRDLVGRARGLRGANPKLPLRGPVVNTSTGSAWTVYPGEN